MAERKLIEQLDQAIEAVLTGTGTPQVEATVKAMARLAEELRLLPRQEFKARLRADLERRINMSTVIEATAPAQKGVREGFHTLTPYLVAQDAQELIEFTKQAFGAEETLRSIGSAGGFHCEVRIGNSMLMIGGGGPGLSWRGESKSTSLHFYVPDADAVYWRALNAGATSVEEPIDQPYGDREAGVRDRAGNYWWIATHKEGGHIPEGLNSVTPSLQIIGANRMVDFLKNAFGAEEVSLYESGGVIRHATLRIGNSAIEMGEAHGPYQPMPTNFYMYVPDVDAVYRTALAAGASSLNEPADQPYGDRTAGVTDPFGNEWFIATNLRPVTA
jgi:uncharacterized glyoxalase superfamily protein PhnB